MRSIFGSFPGFQELLEGSRIPLEKLGQVSEALQRGWTEMMLNPFNIKLLCLGIQAQKGEKP